MSLKPQDILILLKLVAWKRDDWSYGELAKTLHMGVGEVHRALSRALVSRLIDIDKRRPLRMPLLEFLIHGVKYAFPPAMGSQTRGIPTCHAAPFVTEFSGGDDIPPVWPHEAGTVRGLSFEPLYQTAPLAALEDEALYRLLVLVDLIRAGRARERKWAEDALRGMLDAAL